LRARTLVFNAATVDVTDTESVGRWRELLDGAGVKTRASPAAASSRMRAPTIAAKDTIRMIGAGLRGAGYDLDNGAVAAMKSEGGAAGFVDIVARLLVFITSLLRSATFLLPAAFAVSRPTNRTTREPIDGRNQKLRLVMKTCAPGNATRLKVRPPRRGGCSLLGMGLFC
jgi:hypothetical protein